VNLPFRAQNGSLLTTKVLINRVAVTSSFTSNVAQFAAVPFLLLFSFLVALELTNRHELMDQDVTKLLQGDQKFLLNWTVYRLWMACSEDKDCEGDEDCWHWGFDIVV
jgi:hypothetical protein